MSSSRVCDAIVPTSPVPHQCLTPVPDRRVPPKQRPRARPWSARDCRAPSPTALHRLQVDQSDLAARPPFDAGTHATHPAPFGSPSPASDARGRHRVPFAVHMRTGARRASTDRARHAPTCPLEIGGRRCTKVLWLLPGRVLRRPEIRQHDPRILPAQLFARRRAAVAVSYAYGRLTCGCAACPPLCGRRGSSAGRQREQLRGRRRPRLVQADRSVE